MVARACLFVSATLAVSTSGLADPRIKGHLRVRNANPGLCDTSVKSEAGYFNIDPVTNKNYFYWYFASRGNPSTDPVVVWLTVSLRKCLLLLARLPAPSAHRTSNSPHPHLLTC